MTSPSEDLAEELVGLARRGGAANLGCAEGTVHLDGTSAGAAISLARVTGVVEGDLWIPRSRWCAPFIAQVDSARTALNGRSVLLLFVAAKSPRILCTIGD